MSYTATVNVTTGIFHKTSEELNGFEDMVILLTNTAANRTLVGADRDCTLVWSVGPVTLFEGRCTGAKFTRGFLECTIYNTAYEELQRAEPYTATFDEGADVASDILTALGAHVGIAVSWDPVADPAVGVIIDIANPMDVLIWLAEVTGNDFWVTYGPLTLHIGERGAARGAISITDGSTRIIDRSQQRDRVMIRGWDAEGNLLIADTAAGGTRYARYVHKRPVDQATLDALAAKKLADLNKDDGPSPLVVSLASGNTTPLFPGDTVTLNQADMGLPAGDYRIFKIERYLDRVVMHIEVWDASTDRAIWDTRKYEDLGIYAVGVGQLPKGSQQGNSDVVFSTGVDPHDDLDWAAGTFTYADGSTQAIDVSAGVHTGIAVGSHIVYWTYGSTTLLIATVANYADAVGPDKGIIAKVTVPAEATDRMLIETFKSSGTSIGEGALDPTALATPAGWAVGDIVESAGLKDDGTVSSKFTVTIPAVTNVTLYAFGYKINGTAEYTVITSDSNVIVVEGLRAGTVYNCRAAAISKLGTYSAWTATVNKTALGDTDAPGAPTGLAATSRNKAVLLEWNENAETDLDHYEVWMDDGGYAIIAYVRTTYYTWMSTSAQIDTAYNFKIKAVDHTGNASGFSGIVAGTPVVVIALDLAIEQRVWKSNLSFIWDEVDKDWDEFWWGKAGDETTDDATVTFSSAGTSTDINEGHEAALADGQYVYYWDETEKTGGRYDLQRATIANYADAVGAGKGLVAIVIINEAGKNAPTFFTFNSYTPIIGTGIIAAFAIMTGQLTAEQIFGKDMATQIDVGTVNAGIRILGDIAQAVIDGDVLGDPIGGAIAAGIWGFAAGPARKFYLDPTNGRIYVWDAGSFRLHRDNAGADQYVGSLDIATYDLGLGAGATPGVKLQATTDMITIIESHSQWIALDGPNDIIVFDDEWDHLIPQTDAAVTLGDGTRDFVLHLAQFLASPGAAAAHAGKLLIVRPNVTLGKVYVSIETAVNGVWTWVELTPGAGLQNPITADVDWAGFDIEDISQLIVEAGLDDDEAKGIIRDITAGEAITIGEVLYMAADGDYNLARANLEATMIAVCVAIENIANTATGKALFWGWMRDDGVFAGLNTEGAMIYVSTGTAGAMTETRPVAAGHIIQQVAEVKGNQILHFTFDKTFLELA